MLNLTRLPLAFSTVRHLFISFSEDTPEQNPKIPGGDLREFPAAQWTLTGYATKKRLRPRFSFSLSFSFSSNHLHVNVALLIGIKVEQLVSRQYSQYISFWRSFDWQWSRGGGLALYETGTCRSRSICSQNLEKSTNQILQSAASAYHQILSHVRE